jgi:hypothetical protein
MLFALSALVAGAAFAQGEAKKDPAKPEAAAPPLKYESAFEGFRPFQEQEVVSWRKVNQEVARMGGHAGVLKSGQESNGAARQEETGPAPGKTMHRHQGMHGGAK